MRILRWACRVWMWLLLAQVVVLGLLLAVRLALPHLPFLTQPTLAASAPSSGAADVSARQQISLHFSEPMNPGSVARALVVAPATEYTLSWNDDRTLLVVSPAQPLRANTRYRLDVGTVAASRWFRPLLQPASLEFQVANELNVLAAFPTAGAKDVPRDALISVMFSRGMASEPGPASGDVLAFEPPLRGSTTWLDTSTALFQPAEPLQAGTTYTVTVVATPPGENEPLARPYRWTFSTPPPQVLATTPAPDSGTVAPQHPASLHFSQPFALETLRAALSISPTLEYELAEQVLPDATQVVTITPNGGWQPDTTYSIAIGSGLLPSQGNLALAPFRLSFRSAPQPALIGRFPGERQQLAANSEIRLIFNTPVDGESLRSHLRFDPAVPDFALSASGNEARLSAPLAATQLYTLTLAASTTDANGVALGRDYTLRFQAAAAPTALLLPEAEGRVIRLSEGVAGPLVRRTNIAGLQADLYQLDPDSAVRLLAFSERDWREFDPQRSGLRQLRGWSQSYTETGQLVEDRLALGERGPPVAGVYYLRLRTGDLRSDALLFVSNTRLAIRQHQRQAVVWATGADGLPVAGSQLALYRGVALLEQGSSNEQGLWQPGDIGEANQPLVAISADGGLAQAQPAASDPTPPFEASLLTDLESYAPGATVQVGGFLRAQAGGSPGELRGTLGLRSRATAERLASQPVTIAASGVISLSLELPDQLAPGSYLLSLGIGSQLFTRDIQVFQPATSETLAAELPQASVAGAPLGVTFQANTARGLPLAGATISWTVELEPLAELGDGFVVGGNSAVPLPQVGSLTTGADGRASLVLSDTLAITSPQRLNLRGLLARPGQPPYEITASSMLLPADALIGLRLDSQIVEPGQPFSLAVLAEHAAGSPVVSQSFRLDVYQLGGPRPLLVQARSETTGSGPTPYELSIDTPGAYQITATISDLAGRQTQASVPLWVAGASSVWPASPQGPLPLILDRTSYQPGAFARMLLPVDIGQRSVLVMEGSAGQLSVTVQPIRAGSVITVPVQAAALLQPLDLVFSTASGQLRSASTTLVVDGAALRLGVSSDAASYLPGATAVLTFTTTNASGDGVASDLLVGLAQPGQPETGVGWQVLRSDEQGQASTTFVLPDQAGALQVRAWAAGSTSQPAHVERELVVAEPLELELVAPPFVRPGDTTELQARVTNTSPVSQTVDLRLAVQGAVLGSPPRESQPLAPGQTAWLTWNVQASFNATQASAQIQASSPAIASQSREASWPIIAAGRAEGGTGALTSGDWRMSITPGQPLEIEMIGSRAALDQALAEQLEVASSHDASRNAALLIGLPATPAARDSRALASLLASQQSDGGWHWWPNEASNPELTLFVVEGLAAARQNGLAVPDAVLARALTMLDDETKAGTARWLYASALLGQSDTTRAAALADNTQALDSTSLALLLLAGPGDDTRERSLADALLARVSRQDTGSMVGGSGYGGNPMTTALAVQALARVRPESAALGDMRRWLATTRAPGGWPTVMLAVRASAALRPALPETASGAITLALGTQPIYSRPDAANVLAAPLRLRATPDTTTNAFSISSRGTTITSYQPRAQAEPAAGVHLLREYLDPASGAPLDMAALQVGQLVRVRLTVVVRQPQTFFQVAEPIPGGFAVAGELGGNISSSISAEQLLLGQSQLAPGVYQASFLIQAATPGSYQLPATSATLSDGSIIGQGQAAALVVKNTP